VKTEWKVKARSDYLLKHLGVLKLAQSAICGTRHTLSIYYEYLPTLASYLAGLREGGQGTAFGGGGAQIDGGNGLLPGLAACEWAVF
jgi:hypothetical protein